MNCSFSFAKVCPSRLQEVDTPIEQPYEYPQIDIAAIPQHVYRPSNVTIYSVGHLNCMHEREYYQSEPAYTNINASFLYYLFLISHQLSFYSRTKAIMLSLFVRCFSLVRHDVGSIYYLIAVVHLAAKYSQYQCNLKQIIKQGLEAKANLVNPMVVINVEDEILDFLDFDFSFLTVFDFLDEYLSFAQLDYRHEHLVRYMCFYLMTDGCSYYYKPSALAAACISRCLKCYNKIEWNYTLYFWSGRSVGDFSAESAFLSDLLNKNIKEGFLNGGNVIYKLYSKSTHQSVAAIPID